MPAFVPGQALRRFETPAVQPAATRTAQADAEQMVFDRRHLGRSIIHIIPSHRDKLYVGRTRSQPADASIEVAKIEILIPVPVVDAVDKVLVINEMQGFVRLHPGVILFGQQRLDERAVGRIIHVQVHPMLAAVQDLKEHVLRRRIPTHASQVTLLVEVRGLDPGDRLRRRIPDPERDMLGGHPVHRILDGPEFASPRLDVQQREIGHAGLILAVESQPGSVRAPEKAAVDPELIATHGSAIDDAVAAFDDLDRHAPFLDIDAVIQGVGRASGEGHGTGSAPRQDRLADVRRRTGRHPRFTAGDGNMP